MRQSRIEDDESSPSELGQAPNSLLAVGSKDRSFVVKGNKIGVFKHDGDELEFSTTIK